MTTPSTDRHGAGVTGDRPRVPLTKLVHLMAEYQRLGTHRQTFLPTSMSEDTFVRACGLISGGLAIVAGICATASWWTGMIAFVVLALVPLVVAGLRGRLTGAPRTARMDLFDHGLTVYRSGQEITAFRWDSAEVRQSVIPSHGSAGATTVEYSLTLDGPDGSHESFDERQFDSAHEWGPAIQSAVTATQLPGVVAAIDAGERVSFGEIAVDLAELTFAGTSYPWEQVNTIDAQGGLIRFKSGGRWITLPPIESIPNFYIFNEVAERLRIAAAAELAEQHAAQAESAVPPENVVPQADSVPVVGKSPAPEAAESPSVAETPGVEPHSGALQPTRPDDGEPVESEPARPQDADTAESIEVPGFSGRKR